MEAPFPAKKKKHTRFRAGECFQAWINAFQTCYTSQLLEDDDDDDDVDAGDIMMRMQAVTIVRYSEVI